MIESVVRKREIAVELTYVLGRWVGSWAQPLTSPKSAVVISWGLIAVGRRCRGLGLAGLLLRRPPRAVGWGGGGWQS